MPNRTTFEYNDPVRYTGKSGLGPDEFWHLAADMSEQAYSEKGKRVAVQGYTIDKRYSTSNKVVYINRQTGHGFVVFRGTYNASGDLLADAQLGLNLESTSQEFADCVALYDRVAAENPGISFDVTGHSLGGTKALYVASHASPPNQPYATVFNPGTKRLDLSIFGDKFETYPPKNQYLVVRNSNDFVSKTLPKDSHTITFTNIPSDDLYDTLVRGDTYDPVEQHGIAQFTTHARDDGSYNLEPPTVIDAILGKTGATGAAVASIHVFDKLRQARILYNDAQFASFLRNEIGPRLMEDLRAGRLGTAITETLQRDIGIQINQALSRANYLSTTNLITRYFMNKVGQITRAALNALPTQTVRNLITSLRTNGFAQTMRTFARTRAQDLRSLEELDFDSVFDTEALERGGGTIFDEEEIIGDEVLGQEEAVSAVGDDAVQMEEVPEELDSLFEEAEVNEIFEPAADAEVVGELPAESMRIQGPEIPDFQIEGGGSWFDGATEAAGGMAEGAAEGGLEAASAFVESGSGFIEGAAGIMEGAGAFAGAAARMGGRAVAATIPYAGEIAMIALVGYELGEEMSKRTFYEDLLGAEHRELMDLVFNRAKDYGASTDKPGARVLVNIMTLGIYDASHDDNLNNEEWGKELRDSFANTVWKSNMFATEEDYKAYQTQLVKNGMNNVNDPYLNYSVLVDKYAREARKHQNDENVYDTNTNDDLNVLNRQIFGGDGVEVDVMAQMLVRADMLMGSKYRNSKYYNAESMDTVNTSVAHGYYNKYALQVGTSREITYKESKAGLVGRVSAEAMYAHDSADKREQIVSFSTYYNHVQYLKQIGLLDKYGDGMYILIQKNNGLQAINLTNLTSEQIDQLVSQNPDAEYVQYRSKNSNQQLFYDNENPQFRPDAWGLAYADGIVEADATTAKYLSKQKKYQEQQQKDRQAMQPDTSGTQQRKKRKIQYLDPSDPFVSDTSYIQTHTDPNTPTDGPMDLRKRVAQYSKYTTATGLYDPEIMPETNTVKDPDMIAVTDKPLKPANGGQGVGDLPVTPISQHERHTGQSHNGDYNQKGQQGEGYATDTTHPAVIDNDMDHAQGGDDDHQHDAENPVQHIPSLKGNQPEEHHSVSDAQKGVDLINRAYGGRINSSRFGSTFMKYALLSDSNIDALESARAALI